MKLISKLIKLIIFCGFVYQFYDLTNDYLKYKHLSKLEVKAETVIPALTLCVDYRDILPIEDRFLPKFPDWFNGTLPIFYHLTYLILTIT